MVREKLIMSTVCQTHAGMCLQDLQEGDEIPGSKTLQPVHHTRFNEGHAGCKRFEVNKAGGSLQPC